MTSDLLFFVNYTCPRCRAALEAPSDGPPRWMRCPSCGKAGMPPEQTRTVTKPLQEADDVLIIGHYGTGMAALPITPRPMARLPVGPSPKIPTARLLVGTGFFLTTFLFVFSMLESNHVQATIAGVAALICLALLTQRAGQSPST